MKQWILIALCLGLVGCAGPRRSQYLADHPGLQVEYREAIEEGKIRRGMTKEMVRASWGMPQRISESSSGYEEWIYGHQTLQVVMFRSGRVSGWHRIQ